MSAFLSPLWFLSIKHQRYPQHCIFPTEGHDTAIFPVRSKAWWERGSGFGVHAECESEKKSWRVGGSVQGVLRIHRKISIGPWTS